MTAELLTLERVNKKIEDRFESKLEVNFDLNRKLVSFQANKKEPGYRWFKFKEGYSSALVYYVMSKLHVDKGETLDPFAGSGTTLFGASLRGLDSVGIELLPIATEIIEVRKLIVSMDKVQLREILRRWSEDKPWESETNPIKFPHLNITRGAFPEETEKMIGLYLKAIRRKKNKKLQRVLRFSLLCILEEISFTRKDGQYLRWDFRSGRVGGKQKFNKGVIKTFNTAITEKLREIYDDIELQNLFDNKIVSHQGDVKVLGGSCLSILPKIRTSQFSFIMTSPPYCNRYDYTRTYALELALLGVNNESIKDLRQTMISCTVENREKPELESLFNTREYYYAGEAFDSQQELKAILAYLESQKHEGKLNNPGIVRMVKNYFFEMSLVIFECARVLKKNSPMVMVNDNVRYAGATVPVDLILSDFAAKAGLKVERIWVLPNRKGNSSQQMGLHGREALRKCVYVWRKL